MKKKILGIVLVLAGWIVLFPELLYGMGICTVSCSENGEWVEYSLENAARADLLPDQPAKELYDIGLEQGSIVIYKSAFLEMLKKKAKP